MSSPHTVGLTRPRPPSRELSGSPSLPDQKKPRLDVGSPDLSVQDTVMAAASTSGVGRDVTGAGVGIEVDEIAEDATIPATGSKKGPKKGKAKKRRLPPPPEPGSSEDVTWHEVKAALGHENVERILAEKKDWEAPVNFGDEVELEVIDITSNGLSYTTHICGFPRQTLTIARE